MSCHVMSCHVMSCHVMGASCNLVPCYEGWGGVGWRLEWLPALPGTLAMEALGSANRSHQRHDTGHELYFTVTNQPFRNTPESAGQICDILSLGSRCVLVRHVAFLPLAQYQYAPVVCLMLVAHAPVLSHVWSTVRLILFMCADTSVAWPSRPLLQACPTGVCGGGGGGGAGLGCGQQRCEQSGALASLAAAQHGFLSVLDHASLLGAQPHLHNSLAYRLFPRCGGDPLLR